MLALCIKRSLMLIGSDDDRCGRLGCRIRYSRPVTTIQLDPLPHCDIRYRRQLFAQLYDPLYLDVLPRECSRVSSFSPLVVLVMCQHGLTEVKWLDAYGRYTLPREPTLFKTIPSHAPLCLFLPGSSAQLDCQLYLSTGSQL